MALDFGPAGASETRVVSSLEMGFAAVGEPTTFRFWFALVIGGFVGLEGEASVLGGMAAVDVVDMCCAGVNDLAADGGFPAPVAGDGADWTVVGMDFPDGFGAAFAGEL